MSKHIRRPLCFALLLGLTALPLLAAPREMPAALGRGTPAPMAPQSLLARLICLVEKAGSYIDPFGGQPTSQPQPPHPVATSNAGSYIDPFGGH